VRSGFRHQDSAFALGNGVEVRRALPGDAEVLTRIAFAAKRYWGYPERWIKGWRDTLTVTPEFVRDHEVYAAVSGDEPFGFYALAGTGRELELEHLWVSPAWIGSGAGRLLFEHAMDMAASLGAKRVQIEADPNAEGFYLRMGARRNGENVYEIEGLRRVLPLLKMELSRERPETKS
jgi:GNAT superfamily N-acetyltransferase